MSSMLRLLLVKNCEVLETLDDGMVRTRCAPECLEIPDCPSLISLPKGVLPTTLKKLLITDCQKLQSLPEGIMHHASIDSNNTCRLDRLQVWGCLSIKCIPRGSFPSFLELLFIWTCKKLEPIPGNMLQNLTFLGMLGLCNCLGKTTAPG